MRLFKVCEIHHQVLDLNAEKRLEVILLKEHMPCPLKILLKSIWIDSELCMRQNCCVWINLVINVIWWNIDLPDIS